MDSIYRSGYTNSTVTPRIEITVLKIKAMETVKGYKTKFEIKKQHLFCRMDDSMIARLKEIRKKTGISVSEIIREAVRRMLQDVDESGSINLKLN